MPACAPAVVFGAVVLEGISQKERPTRGQDRGLDFEQIRVAIEKVRQETWATMASRHGDWGRDLALYLMRENGHSLRAAARSVGIKRAPTAGMAIKRFEARLATDNALRKAVEQVTESLR